MFTGIPICILSDNATCFASKLNLEFLKRLGASPRFGVPGYAQAQGLAERMVATLKNAISKCAHESPKQWHKKLGYILWALREIPNETTHVAPWILVHGFLPRGPLAILKETWAGERELPLDLGKTAVEYLNELKLNLQTACDYADSHAMREQNRYVAHHNLRSRDKSFSVGEQVLILKPDSTNKLFSRWSGPASVVERLSNHSYLVEIDGSRK